MTKTTMSEGQPKGPEQSQADFTPNEAEWGKLKEDLERLISIQRSLEQQYNPRGATCYTDFRVGLGLTYQILVRSQKKPKAEFVGLQRYARAWENYLSWLANNEAFREAEFKNVSGYFPEIRDEFRNLPSQEEQLEYARQLMEKYDGSNFLAYVEKSAERFVSRDN